MRPEWKPIQTAFARWLGLASRHVYHESLSELAGPLLMQLRILALLRPLRRSVFLLRSVPRRSWCTENSYIDSTRHLRLSVDAPERSALSVPFGVNLVKTSQQA
jgi:hypothetical protein